MSAPTDGYKLYNAAGQLIGEGTGHVEVGEDETLVTVDVHADDVELQTLSKQIRAYDKLEYISSKDRNFAAKYETAKEYLLYRQANPSAPDADPYTLIDPDLFPEIYDEFYYNYDLTPWSDIEFCERIVERHEARLLVLRQRASLSEAKLRREKLLAEQDLGVDPLSFITGVAPEAE